MSLDITIRERQEFYCPDCGRLVTTQDIGAECSSGRVWYGFLESVGYYVECDNLTEENDWYGKDMVLTEEQEKQLADFVSDNKPYNARDVEFLVARANITRSYNSKTRKAYGYKWMWDGELKEGAD